MADAGIAVVLGIAPATAEGWVRELTAPHRHYHTIEHVRHIEAAYRGLGGADPAIRAAAWLHDIRYDARRADNEEVSADIARVDLAGSTVDVDRVVEIILDTKHHVGGDPGLDLFGDLDLGILGSERARYDWYMRAIRREYAFVPLALYAPARADILRRFDDRRIFKTAAFAAREAPAHANLRYEIEMLTRNPDHVEQGDAA